jgi:hypothetical protein
MYDLIHLLYFRKARTSPTPLYRNIGSTLVHLVRKCRRYWHESANAEILAELHKFPTRMEDM